MPQSAACSPEPSSGALYRAFWRWHFYAGLAILPVLMLMALTGGLYLFKPEIEGLLHQDLLRVAPGSAITTPQAWAAAARRATTGIVVQMTPPTTPTDPARLVIETPSGRRDTVFVDPHDAQVLGAIRDGGLMQTIKQLHSLEIAGPIANLLVELVAGWAIVMVATGVVLWWPRGQAGGVVTVRGPPKRRLFWRDLHAVVGLFAAAVIVFLAVTGMPWSGFWGQEVRKLTTDAGLGRPKPPASAAAWGHAPGHKMADSSAVPWALQETEMHGDPMDHPALSLNDAVALVNATDLSRPYVLSIPQKPGKAWSAAYMPDQVEKTRTLYLDPADGAVLADIGYQRFGPAAKAIEWGIAVHQGQQYGLVNKLVMLAGCIAVWLLGVSAIVMWWKRRPKGRLAAPPAPTDKRVYLAVAAVVLPLGLFYPLVGGSLLIILTLDFVIRRIAKAVRPQVGAPT
jgi:uncharacterized iron-regulated membrane protein